MAGTPTFFINEHRHDGPQDLPVLSKVIAEARAQASVPAQSRGHHVPVETAANPIIAVSPDLGFIPAIPVQRSPDQEST